LPDDRGPHRIELVRRRRAAPAGDTVGLLDEGNAERRGPSGLRRRDEVGRADATARAVPENQRSPRPIDRVEVDVRYAVWRLELDDRPTLPPPAATGSLDTSTSKAGREAAHAGHNDGSVP
jgi:hypothetical protein